MVYKLSYLTNTKQSISKRIPTFLLISTVAEYQYIDNPTVKSNYYEKEFGLVKNQGAKKGNKKQVKQLIHEFYAKMYEDRAQETF
jgi:hypothetical protein